MYNKLYKIINKKYINGELTLEQANELNDLAYDKYVTEKKATWKYRLQKWKKENDYDPKTGTIDVDGHRVKFNFTGGSGKRNIANKANADFDYYDNNDAVYWPSERNSINADKASFNMKHSDSHKFIMGHEKGHYLEMDAKHKDPNKYKNDYNKKKKFIDDEIENSKLPSKHNREIEEYRSDDYGVKFSSPKAMKHEAKDYLKAVRKSNNRYGKSESEYDKELSKELTNKIHEYEKMANSTTNPDERERYMIKARNLKSLSKEVLQPNDLKRSYKREKDGYDMRLKSAINDKVKKRDIKK